ncbi:MAG: hypothetical protein WDN01_18925 [Rhizomicrobium sp.]
MQKTTEPKPAERDGARRRAQNHFELAEARTTLVKQMVDAERKALDTKTEKLRALRLAKEEADRIEAANAPPPAPKTRKAKTVKAV